MTGIEEELQGEGPWTLADAWTSDCMGDLGTLGVKTSRLCPLGD